MSVYCVEMSVSGRCSLIINYPANSLSLLSGSRVLSDCRYLSTPLAQASSQASSHLILTQPDKLSVTISTSFFLHQNFEDMETSQSPIDKLLLRGLIFKDVEPLFIRRHSPLLVSGSTSIAALSNTSSHVRKSFGWLFRYSYHMI